VEDQVFKVNLWTRISNPSAHDDLQSRIGIGLQSIALAG
jgi:hypothetical protein